MICLAEDDYVRELQDDRATAVWVAKLSDGTTAYQDDGRPGVAPHSAWLRLRRHCEENKVRVVGLKIKFRSNESNNLPANAGGYFFARSAAGILNDATTFHFYLVGWLSGEEVHVERWEVPSLILLSHELRPASSAGECLLRNPE